MKRRELSETRKETIFQAAVHCFNEAGYDSTTVDAIALKAGMSKGGIYHYFRSKKDLFLELFDYRVHKYFTQMKSYIKVDQKPSEKLITLIQKAGEILKQNEDFYKFCLEFLSMGVRDPDIKKIMTRFYQESMNTFKKIIEEGIAVGEFKEIDANKAARSCYLSVMGAFFTYFSVNVDFDIAEQHSFDINNILKAISHN